MNVNPLLRFEADIHERLQVVDTERSAIVPGTGLILERARKGRGEERSVLLSFCQIDALMLPHRSVVAGRSDEVLVAMMVPPCMLNCR